jgi:hypothetical protein
MNSEQLALVARSRLRERERSAALRRLIRQRRRNRAA